MPPAQRSLLESLCVLKEADTETLASRTYLSIGATRLHLAKLVNDQLIEMQPRRGPSAGRPLHLFRLTDAGRALFPRGETFTLMAVLDVLERHHPDVYERLWSEVTWWFRSPQLPPSKSSEASFAHRVDAVQHLLRRYGHLVDSEPSEDSAVFTVHHCAILQAARHHNGICRAEEAWLRTVFPDADVSVVARQVDGAASCEFRVQQGREQRG